MAKWFVAAKKADFNKIAEEFHISPIIARIIRNRDVTGTENIRKYLYGTAKDFYAPELMYGITEGAKLILIEIAKQVKMRIIGDYDVDGICSTYILHEGLTRLGADVDTVIPHRIRDGYGLNTQLIEDAKADGIQMIITCDNGIAAREQIALAKSYGMTVIVTDHHEVPFELKDNEKQYLLPKADVIIDPKQENCSYPFKQICGAVVAYKLICYLFEEQQIPDQEEREQELLAFAALATICDVMELCDENRILVREGLKAIEQTKNPGLRALLAVNELEHHTLSPYHAGFILGPCLNASGRLDSAQRALALFEATEYREAVGLAADLKALNDSRKQMTETETQKAFLQIEEQKLNQDRVLIVYLPECHESLAGIIAGKVREQYGKPAFVLTKAEDGIKGSGRSIESYHMFEEMTACSEYFTKFGGHKLAAGCSLKGEEMIAPLREALNRHCILTDEDFEEHIHIDVPLPPAYADRAFIKELSVLEPFGVGNPKPLFARKDISLLAASRMGKSGRAVRFTITDESGQRFQMIYFGDCAKLDAFLQNKYSEEIVNSLYAKGLKQGEALLNVAYYPDINAYRGQENIQLIMQYYC